MCGLRRFSFGPAVHGTRGTRALGGLAGIHALCQYNSTIAFLSVAPHVTQETQGTGAGRFRVPRCLRKYKRGYGKEAAPSSSEVQFRRFDDQLPAVQQTPLGGTIALNLISGWLC